MAKPVSPSKAMHAVVDNVQSVGEIPMDEGAITYAALTSKEDDPWNIKGIGDSGSNTDLISKRDADSMVQQGLCTMTSCKGGTVQSCFQGSTQPIIGYITSKGGILEKMWVVDGLHSNLVSVRSFTRQGYQVVFNDQAMQILNQTHEVINEGQLDPKTDLYVINLTKLLRPPRPLPAAFTATRFYPKAIRMAKELHNATKHIPYSTSNRISQNMCTPLPRSGR